MQSHPVPMPRDIQEKDLNRDLEVCLDNLLFADERKAALLSQYRAVQAELAEKWLDTLLLRSGNARGEELLELLLISYRTLLDERKVSVTDAIIKVDTEQVKNSRLIRSQSSRLVDARNRRE